MPKSSLILIAFVCLALSAKAQDIIVKRDSSNITGKVIEIRTDQVCYQLPEAPSSKSLCISSDLIAYVIFQNGYRQKFELMKYEDVLKVPASNPRRRVLKDSASYYKFHESVSINYLNFANREFGLIYQREFLSKHLAVVVPVTIGLDKPVLTHSVYFKNNFTYTVDNKIFDMGLGLSYFPTYKSNVNYFAGPMLRTLFYRGTQILYPETNVPLQVKSSTLTRLSLSITNGIQVRTRSRLQMSIFGSVGACYDLVTNQIRRPTDNKRINPIKDPLSLYFWFGFTMGYCF